MKDWSWSYAPNKNTTVLKDLREVKEQVVLGQTRLVECETLLR